MISAPAVAAAFTLLAAPAAALPTPGPHAPSEPAPSSSAADGTWFHHVIFQVGEKLGGCAIGDLDPGHPGNEVVAVAADGRVYLARGKSNHWVTETIFEAPGEMIQCAIGDADPRRPGNELVLVGTSEGREDDGNGGLALMVWREGKEWKSRTLFESPALIHACAIADLDPTSEGNEIYLGGFDQVVWQASFLEDDSVDIGLVCPVRGPVKSLVPLGDELAIACADGRLMLGNRLALGWSARPLDEADAGQARLGVLDGRLITARDDGKLLLVDAQARSQAIYGEDDKLRGAALGDLVPDRPGPEAATVGYEARLTVLTESRGSWQPRTVFTDEAPLHHLAIGELVEESPGLELVTCGYSGRLVLAGLDYRGSGLAPDSGGD